MVPDNTPVSLISELFITSISTARLAESEEAVIVCINGSDSVTGPELDKKTLSCIPLFKPGTLGIQSHPALDRYVGLAPFDKGV